MFTYFNPVEIIGGDGALSALNRQINGRQFALVTHGQPAFSGVAATVERAIGHAPLIRLTQVAENPDLDNLRLLCEQLSSVERPEMLIAVGGGSVMDACKVLSATGGDYTQLASLLDGDAPAQPIPFIAVPTTAGTGSEVTCWATVWDPSAQRKHSLAHPSLYARCAVLDPELTMSLPRSLTIATALDALSHAFESLWNRNRNPVSTMLAISAARQILQALPALLEAPYSLRLRGEMQVAATTAGLAFSNTKTSIAHSISYPITLQKGTAHGIACSITLPMLVGAVDPEDEVAADIAAILGAPPLQAAEKLQAFFSAIGISTDPQTYGYDADTWQALIVEAAGGARGRNYNGSVERLGALYRDYFESRMAAA